MYLVTFMSVSNCHLSLEICASIYQDVCIICMYDMYVFGQVWVCVCVCVCGSQTLFLRAFLFAVFLVKFRNRGAVYDNPTKRLLWRHWYQWGRSLTYLWRNCFLFQLVFNIIFWSHGKVAKPKTTHVACDNIRPSWEFPHNPIELPIQPSTTCGRRTPPPKVSKKNPFNQQWDRWFTAMGSSLSNRNCCWSFTIWP